MGESLRSSQVTDNESGTQTLIPVSEVLTCTPTHQVLCEVKVSHTLGEVVGGMGCLRRDVDS